jgi:hypothetical protein
MHDTTETPTIAERLDNACIGYVDTPDGYEIKTDDDHAINVRPSPSNPDLAWVTVTRPDRRERDTGGVRVDDYEIPAEHVVFFLARHVAPY